MQPSLDDLSTTDIRDVLTTTEQRLGRRLEQDNGHYSKWNGTAGFPTDAGTWVRLAWRRENKLDAQQWTGFEAAAAIEGVPRPRWFGAAVWSDESRGVVWRADEMTLVQDGALSPTGDITTLPKLPESWWTDLQAALGALASHPTSRVSMSRQHLTNRIHEVYGDQVDTTVTDWATAHGDVGYANLCGPGFALLDWESWGLAPAGWDAACLWSASLSVEPLAEKVLTLFEDSLATKSGVLSRLLLCANVERAYRRTGRETPMTKTMAGIAEGLLGKLSVSA
ncbi:aminoglycoside phosphotransferase [Streptomyces sp. NPDC002044]|uniref:aminoglycoside phosphotransferase n=1 Tax=Streptomyces sp. NPDC002044 TaxID=3154662 RepID=UPI00332E0BE7